MALELILKSLYFFLPAYFANMAPVLFKKIPLMLFRKIPLEKLAISKKLFGENKTWWGIAVGTLIGGIVFGIQKLIHQLGSQRLTLFQEWALIDYSDFSLLLGFLMGFGALLGDLVKSYYKRKAGIAPGKPWIPFDQIDFVVGGLVFGLFVYAPPVEVAVVLLLISPLLHVLVNYIGYLLKINKNKI